MAAPTPAKRSPDGYVAQRFPGVSAGRPWVLTYLDGDNLLSIQTLTDEDITDWAPLHDETER